jgi:hypothetical protein
MRKQFYYTVVNEDKEAAPVDASFNVDRVIRTIEYSPGKTVVLLDDFHEEKGKRPAQRANGKVTMETFNECVYSSIYLNEEDSQRFKALFNVEENAAPVVAE